MLPWPPGGGVGEERGWCAGQRLLTINVGRTLTNVGRTLTNVGRTLGSFKIQGSSQSYVLNKGLVRKCTLLFVIHMYVVETKQYLVQYTVQ